LGVVIGNFANEPAALYCSHGDPLSFTDDAVAVGIGPLTRSVLTFGMLFCDMDLDGRLDILAANGHLEGDINKVQKTQHYRQSPQLFWNAGPASPTEFVLAPVNSTGESFAAPLVGRGAVVADVDGDGDSDLLLTATGDKPRLLRNDQAHGHHWLRLKLMGTQSNRDAIGAWAEVTLGNRTLRRQVMPTRSYLSQCELPLTFGLGAATSVDRVTIRWPSGQVQELDVEQVDRLIEVQEPVRVAQRSP
jgi:hypothetical protein